MYNIFKSRSTKHLTLSKTQYSSVLANVNHDSRLLEDYDRDHSSTINVLRIWEPKEYGIVLGRSNKADVEVLIREAEHDNIPIIKRGTGGGTVMLGPGCLCYTFILNINNYPEFDTISKTNQNIMIQIKQSLEPLIQDINIMGYTDLCTQNKKFSGNAQKRKKNYLLFHGTILYNTNIDLIERYLQFPSRSPNYREEKTHKDFLINVNFSARKIITCMQNYFIV